MKYKCKLIVKDNLYDGLMSSFKMILKYKKEKQLFYDEVKLIDANCCLHSNYTKEILIPKLKSFNESSEEEFMNFIRETLIKTLGIQNKEEKCYKELDENIKILKGRSKEFFIEI